MRTAERMATVLMVGLFSMIMVGCASTTDNSTNDGDKTWSAGGNCFFARSVRNFEALSDNLLIVWAPSQRCPYKVEVMSFCQGLKTTNAIVFNPQGSICGRANERLLIRDMGADRSCRIGKVSRLSAQELIDLRAEYGKSSPDEDPDNTTPDCTGTETSGE
jgi:hypothetical protein